MVLRLKKMTAKDMERFKADVRQYKKDEMKRAFAFTGQPRWELWDYYEQVDREPITKQDVYCYLKDGGKYKWCEDDGVGQ